MASLVVAALGCTPAPARPPPARVPVVPASVAKACATPRLVIPNRVEIKSWPERSAPPTIPITIDNCTDVAWETQWAHLKGGRDDLVGIELEKPIAPRSAFTWRHRVDWEGGRRTLLVAVVRKQPDAPTILEAPVEIVDPAYEADKAACLAKGDEWGEHGGMHSHISCEQVMPDAGRPCSDARECQGLCILDREEPVSLTEKRVFGHCTRLRGAFGCHTIIGKTNHGVMPSKLKFSHSCID